MLPVAWAPTHRGHGNHVAVVLPNALGNFAREPEDSKLPAGEKTRSRCAGLGVRSNQVDDRGHGIVQLAARPGPAILIPTDGLDRFLGGGCAELIQLHRRRMSRWESGPASNHSGEGECVSTLWRPPCGGFAAQELRPAARGLRPPLMKYPFPPVTALRARCRGADPQARETPSAPH